MELEQFNWRRIAFIALGVGILIIAIALLANYMTHGKVIIETGSNNNTITLTQISGTGDDDDQKTRPKPITARHTLSANVKTGQYVAVVDGNSIASSRLIKVLAHHTTKLTINPIDASGMSPVTYANAQNTIANSSQLLYLDNFSGTVKKIDASNQESTIGQNQRLKSVAWADMSLGIGQDSEGHLYVIDVAANSITPLSVPFSYATGTNVSYAVTPTKQIYVSSGANVYAGNQNGNFKKTYTAATKSPTLTAGPNKVLVNDNLGEGNRTQPFIAVVNSSGKQAGANIEVNIASWSPDGKYVFVAAERGAFILNSSLQKVASTPTAAFVSHLAWVNSDTLLYSTDSQLWIYNFKTQDARLLANTPLDQGILDLSVSQPDKDYVYLVSNSKPSGNPAIRRVGLKGQETQDFIYQLQNILPQNFLTYSINLVNFSGATPTILVQPYPDVPNANYAQMATSELQGRGFDTSKLHFQLLPPGAPSY